MSKNEKDNFVATKAEQTFDDEGNIQVAEVDKKTTLREALGNKRGFITRSKAKKPFKIKKILLDNSAKVIKLK